MSSQVFSVFYEIVRRVPAGTAAFYTESWADRLGEKMTSFLERRETHGHV